MSEIRVMSTVQLIFSKWKESDLQNLVVDMILAAQSKNHVYMERGPEITYYWRKMTVGSVHSSSPVLLRIYAWKCP